MVLQIRAIIALFLASAVSSAFGQTGDRVATTPTADFTATPTSGLVPFVVSFQDASTGPVTKRIWDFGDGDVVVQPVGSPAPTRTYDRPGSYDVALTVIGPSGTSRVLREKLIRASAPVPDVVVDFPDFVFVDDEISFEVTVTDPNDDRVSVRCTNPPRGLIFEPALDVPSPVTIRGRFSAKPPGGFLRLRFDARNSTYPDSGASGYAETTIFAGFDRGNLRAGDVNGDGRDDVVARSNKDGGTIHVWLGRADPSGVEDAVLDLGSIGAVSHIDLVDLTGDGILDIVVHGLTGLTRTHSLFVGRADFSGTIAATATFTGDLGQAPPDTQVPLFGDVTGDGILDMITVVRDGNGVFVWAGGPSLGGAVPPTASLPVSVSAGGDDLANVTGQGLLLHDVTGDGIRDIVSGTHRGEFGAGPTDVGALFVWHGGSGLEGTLPPTATLRVSTAVAGDNLGFCEFNQAILFEDVDADGIDDVLTVAPNADIDGVADTGAAYMWAGGASLTGLLDPTATLTVPGALPIDNLGLFSPQPILFAEVTGDDYLDVITGSFAATNRNGAAYVFAGGPGFVGSRSPVATLTVEPGEGETEPSLYYARFADVVGDDTLDVIALSSNYEAGGYTFSGGVFVWEGGAGLMGSPLPNAILTAPTADFERLGAGEVSGLTVYGTRIHVDDLNADGRADILTSTPKAAPGGVVDSGHVVYWAGGAGLSGSPAPTATLTIPSAAPGDALSSSVLQGVYIADVTGDGSADVVVGSRQYDTGTPGVLGGFFVWEGGPSMAGSPAPRAVLRGGTDLVTLGFQAFHLLDLNDDGLLDILTGEPNSEVEGFGGAGAFYLWHGGTDLTGVPPAIRLTSETHGVGDRLGSVDLFGVVLDERLCDTNGDGRVDVMAAAARGDANASDDGYICNWQGPIDASSEAPLMSHAGSGNNDNLGR